MIAPIMNGHHDWSNHEWRYLHTTTHRYCEWSNHDWSQYTSRQLRVKMSSPSHSSDSEDFACAAIIIVAHGRERRNRKWTNDWLLHREDRGSYGSLFSELRTEDAIFSNYLRLSLPLFESLLEKVKNHIEKQDTPMRNAIPSGARLEATLLFLITGMNYSRLQYSVRMSPASLSAIIPETCKVIYSELKDEYLKVSVYSC